LLLMSRYVVTTMTYDKEKGVASVREAIDRIT
jgi:hypothetical protein